MASLKNKVAQHVKGDIKSFKKEIKEDRELLKEIKHPKKKKHDPKKHDPKKKHVKKDKIEKVMHEYKEGKLHSGSKKGPKVTNPKQAIAIALSEARKAKKKK